LAKSARASYNKKKKGNNKILLFLFPIILIVLIGLIAVLDNESSEVGQEQAQSILGSVSLEGQPVLGPADAKVTVIKFGDYNCGACAQWDTMIFDQLKADYVDTGLIKYTSMNFPFLRPSSFTASYASEAVFAADPEGFWDFHHALFVNQGAWDTAEDLVELAKIAAPNVNADELKQNIDNATYKAQVDTDIDLGTQAKVEGTPAIFVNGKMTGADYLDYDALKKLIDQELAAAE